MVFVANQKQNETYAFWGFFSQPDKNYFIVAMIKELEMHKI